MENSKWHLQYGGCFEDARKSLCANFIRIKGDSRLTWEEAHEPIRAAWQRIEAAGAHGKDWELSRAMVLALQESCCV